MSISKCPKCDGTAFKLVTQSPAGSRYKVNFIQCAACNSPIGTMDYFNTGTQLEEQKTAIDQLGRQMTNLEAALAQIVRALRGR